MNVMHNVHFHPHPSRSRNAQENDDEKKPTDFAYYRSKMQFSIRPDKHSNNRQKRYLTDGKQTWRVSIDYSGCPLSQKKLWFTALIEKHRALKFGSF